MAISAGSSIRSGNITTTNINMPMDKAKRSSCKYVVVQPKGRRAWIFTVASLLCVFVSDGILLGFGLALTDSEHFFANAIANKMRVFSLITGSLLVSGIVVSALTNGLGFRAAVVIASIIRFAGLLLCFMAQSFNVYCSELGVLFGFMEAISTIPVAIKEDTGTYFSKKRAIIIGIALCFSGAGALVFAPVIYFLIKKYDTTKTYFILSFVYLGCALLGWLLVPLEHQRRKKTVEEPELHADYGATGATETTPISNEAQRPSQTDKKSIRKCFANFFNSIRSKLSRALPSKSELLSQPKFEAICFSRFFQSFGSLMPFLFLPAHAIKMEIPKVEAIFLLSVVGISSVVGRIFYGLLSRYPKVNMLYMNNIGLVLTGIVIILCPFLRSYWLLALYSVIFGLASSCSVVIHPLLLEKLLSSGKVKNVYRFINAFHTFGTYAGIFISGFLCNNFGDYDVAFYVAGSSVLISALIYCFLGRLTILSYFLKVVKFEPASNL